MSLLPAINGTTTVRTAPQVFVAAFARRVQSGLLDGSASARQRYAVINSSTDSIRFRATSWPTAISVGLNDVRLAASPGGAVKYHVEFKAWAIYSLSLSAVIGALLIAFLLIFDLRAYLASNAGWESLLLTTDQSIAIAWGMALFWGFVWPWILIALHKRPLRQLIERIIAEVDASAQPK